jgi:polar amino acid transport system substrate-binding protein
MNRLEAWAPLGYSCSGKIIEVGSEVTEFSVGDEVSCGGGEAGHAEVVSVPVNLCAKIPEGGDIQHAAYTTLGAIALQGIRQADLRLGESCAVIGLGLLGQLTVQMLKAGGVSVFGIDVNPAMVEKAIQNGADFAFSRDDSALEQAIFSSTESQGVDAVIITAGTSSLDPVELAGRLARKKGKVVVVGAVPTGFSRENYYTKELELRMSCSYGPGRYDPVYEEKGIDYPYGYVRWTEKRNMESFLKFVANKQIKFDNLTSHIFDFDKAQDAYKIILEKSEPFLGILLKYHPERDIQKSITLNGQYEPSALQVGFIGAGSFAQNFLLPKIKEVEDVTLDTVVNSKGNTARTAAEKFGFQKASTDESDVYKNADISTVFIATRHNLHAHQVRESLQAGKHVFVEKPLATTLSELEEIKTVYQKITADSSAPPILMVGFNRRFAPLIQRLKTVIKSVPLALNYRINAGLIPASHWTQDVEVGGGRIIGEVCHFIDLSIFLADSLPALVSAEVMDDPQSLNDTLVINLKFKNGSIAAISYFANGNKNLDKEYLEVHGNGMAAILNDFRELTIYGKGKKKIKSSQDKGHREEVKRFLTAVKEGQPAPISFEEIYMSSLLPFKVIESIRTGNKIKI